MIKSSLKDRKLVYEVDPKVALITGSTSGCGQKLALYLSKIGLKLVITGRDEDRIKSVAQQCRQLSNTTVLEVKADLLDDNQVRQLLDTTIDQMGRLDILIHCAQISLPLSITDTDVMQKFDTVFRLNVRSAVLLTSMALPYIQAISGGIITLTSDSGFRPYDQEFAFCITESAVNYFTKCLALETKGKGVSVLTLNSDLVNRKDFDLNPWLSTTLVSRL
ncbi:uncharacterized oxidoreductase SERP2049-like [Oppia nitens]|uniref:uncharacterized oxidoreductase SERP2049-like n=1 Tax=Oppia nitens TaxID=1686743 RepID=UPI0023DA9E5D|nr:uncharacterized oxidoreductase SERP2049-like [Oppia nitens]